MKFLGPPSSGSLAGTTSSHNRAGQYTRNRRAPTQPVGTGRRAAIRTAFGSAAKYYASLTSAQQAAWTAYAAMYPVTDALGQSITLTGQQMCVAINTQLQNCGQAMNAVPPVSNAVASAGVPTFTVVSAGAITLTPTGLGAASDFLLYAFSSPQSSGTSFCKTFWQAGKVAGNSTAAIVATTPYHAQFGTPAVGNRVFIKATPVNQYGVTGTPYIGFASATQVPGQPTLIQNGTSTADVFSLYGYPTTAPTAVKFWSGTTGIGNPTSNPSGWTNHGFPSCTVTDTGTGWKVEFTSGVFSSGNYYIAQLTASDPSFPYTTVVHWV